MKILNCFRPEELELSAVQTDVVFPAAVSNWGAYGIVAMLAFLLKKPEILQDADMEQ